MVLNEDRDKKDNIDNNDDNVNDNDGENTDRVEKSEEVGYDVGTETEMRNDEGRGIWYDDLVEGETISEGYDDESSTEMVGENNECCVHNKGESYQGEGLINELNLESDRNGEAEIIWEAGRGESSQQAGGCGGARGKQYKKENRKSNKIIYTGCGARARHRRCIRMVEGDKEAARSGISLDNMRWEARRRQSTGAACGSYRLGSTGAESGVERGGVKYAERGAGREREKKGEKELVTGKGRNKGERENYEERVAGWDRQNKDLLYKMDFIDVIDLEGGLDLVYLNENRKREGELDGNTVYWEYKKG
jgi:hypothetical protein